MLLSIIGVVFLCLFLMFPTYIKGTINSILFPRSLDFIIVLILAFPPEALFSLSNARAHFLCLLSAFLIYLFYIYYVSRLNEKH